MQASLLWPSPATTTLLSGGVPRSSLRASAKSGLPHTGICASASAHAPAEPESEIEPVGASRASASIGRACVRLIRNRRWAIRQRLPGRSHRPLGDCALHCARIASVHPTAPMQTPIPQRASARSAASRPVRRAESPRTRRNPQPLRCSVHGARTHPLPIVHPDTTPQVTPRPPNLKRSISSLSQKRTARRAAVTVPSATPRHPPCESRLRVLSPLTVIQTGLPGSCQAQADFQVVPFFSRNLNPQADCGSAGDGSESTQPLARQSQ